MNELEHKMSELRKTTQKILPLRKESVGEDQYDIYPAHNLGENRIFEGYDSLAHRIRNEKSVVIDGYVGVRFDDFARNLNIALTREGISARWWAVDAALRDEEVIDRLAEPWLGGEDPLFGFRTPVSLSEFFDLEILNSIKPTDDGTIDILYGCGAALAGWDGLLIYLDIPKNEIQFRARAGSICNLGKREPEAPKKMYKRFYFFDWVVLNRHKKAVFGEIGIMVDAQREETITWAEGDIVRNGLKHLASNGFRPRPWFEPGAWGGQWIREHIKALPSDVPNYAWSFEMIVPENGILFCSGSLMLEVSFDSIMFQAGEQVVGKVCYATYGDEFPIRLDFLDNVRGGNLSIQCHPRKEFIQKNFGEVLTQEETYYILETTPGAQVYLGFQEDIDPHAFEQALQESYEKAEPLDVPRYVHAEPARQHGLYLIPPGTLHSSGQGNLVLEISTTPYIFTFKMYDWLSLDLDGKPRPLNIRRAMENLYFDRKGARIPEEFVSKPELLSQAPGWELWHLPTHPNHSYDVHRYLIWDRVEVETEGRFHALNLVSGAAVRIVTAKGVEYRLSKYESFIVPAASQRYVIINDGQEPVMVVKAFMK